MQPYVLVPPNGSDPVEEWIRLGLEAQQAQKFPDAERYYRQALRLDPRHATATQNLAVLFAQTNNLNDGLLAIERAALFDGVHTVIHCNRALMCLQAGRIDEALKAAEYAVSISKPDEDVVSKAGYTASRVALATVSGTAGLADQAIRLYQEVLAREPAHPVAGPNACFVSSLTAAGPAEVAAIRKAWYEANGYKGTVPPHTNDRNPDRPLRVGYVGGDFKRHSAAMIFGNVVMNHDREVVTPYLYSSLAVDPAADDMTRRFREAAGDNWRDISAMTDEQAAAQIRADRIDVLVDLAAHTGGGRLALFTHKPAPVQVTAWGFAHGTGVPQIDAFLADPVAVPEHERQHYAERIIDLPCVVTYLPPAEYNLKGTSTLPYWKNEYVTFGSYARFEKLSDQCLQTLAEILRRVPDSRLEFKDHAFNRPYSIKRVRAAMPDIAPERLLFSISTGHPEHMLAHQQADLALDPFPHGGGVVALEQLYMGVPLITLYGTQPAGRSASSVLTALGRTDWIARTPAEYVEKAVEWANRPQDLAKARKTLRNELLSSPVVKGYPAAVEAAYRNLWREWCAR